MKTAAELREKIAASSCDARKFIADFYDEGTFLESGTYIKNGADGEFEGVITGCGAVDGRLVFAFIQDFSNGRAAFTAAHAKKICALYDKAMRAKAPVVAVLASAGAKLSEGIDAVSGYGAVIKKSNKAKNVIPQISVIAGACGGILSALASGFDFTVADEKNGELYVLPESDESKRKGVKADILCSKDELAAKTAELISYIPSNSGDGTVCMLTEDDVNRPSDSVEAIVNTNGDAKELISALADNGAFYELTADKAKELVTGFAFINDRCVGIVANQPTENGGALTCGAAKKAARFIDFLGRFGVPVLTLVNTEGFGGKECGCYSDAIASMAAAYAGCESPKVTAVVGKAYGSAFTLMGSKELGADYVFALDNAVISVMKPETAVEFVWDDKVKAASDPEAARAELKKEWISVTASPLSAARTGCIDDIVAYPELRQRIAAAFEILVG